MDQIVQHLDSGMDPYESVLESAIVRFRPIMLAAVTTVLGLIPMFPSKFWCPWQLHSHAVLPEPISLLP